MIFPKVQAALSTSATQQDLSQASQKAVPWAPIPALVVTKQLEASSAIIFSVWTLLVIGKSVINSNLVNNKHRTPREFVWVPHWEAWHEKGCIE